MEEQKSLQEKSKREKPKGRRNFRKTRNRRPQKKAPPVMCAICGKPIESITQAIGGPEKDEISHFDCILRRLEEEEKIVPGQKVSYVGNGTFAVIEYKNRNYTGGFTIIKRIQIENKETTDFVKRLVNDRKKAVELFRRR